MKSGAGGAASGPARSTCRPSWPPQPARAATRRAARAPAGGPDAPTSAGSVAAGEQRRDDARDDDRPDGHEHPRAHVARPCSSSTTSSTTANSSYVASRSLYAHRLRRKGSGPERQPDDARRDPDERDRQVAGGAREQQAPVVRARDDEHRPERPAAASRSRRTGRTAQYSRKCDGDHRAVDERGRERRGRGREHDRRRTWRAPGGADGARVAIRPRPRPRSRRPPARPSRSGGPSASCRCPARPSGWPRAPAPSWASCRRGSGRPCPASRPP